MGDKALAIRAGIHVSGIMDLIGVQPYVAGDLVVTLVSPSLAFSLSFLAHLDKLVW